MGYIEKYVVNENNVNRIDADLTYNKVHTLIIEDTKKNVAISNINIEILIIRNTRDVQIYLNKCQVAIIKCENSTNTKLNIKYCKIYEVSGDYGYIYLYNSDLAYSSFSTQELFLKNSNIKTSEIDIKRSIELNIESNIHGSTINLLRNSASESNVIIYNKVGSRGDNLVIFKHSKLIKTGCFVGSIYDFIRRIYDVLNMQKYYYSISTYVKCYEEYITITDNVSKELLSDKELLAYRALKLYLRLYYKFNNPYKK